MLKQEITFRHFILTIILFSLFSISPQADELYITDDYLQGLNDEVSDPEYLTNARKELRETEAREKAKTTNKKEIEKALISMYNFEVLLREKYPSTHNVYSRLPVSARILIFDKFKKTRKLSAAKRMIIEKYESK